MATVSFSQESYDVGENENTVNVSVVRSGDTESQIVVLIASDPIESSATGTSFLVSVTFPMLFSLICPPPHLFLFSAFTFASCIPSQTLFSLIPLYISSSFFLILIV